MQKATLLQINARQGLSCPQVPTQSLRFSSLSPVHPHTDAPGTGNQGIVWLREWKGTALSFSVIPSLPCRHACVPSVDQAGLIPQSNEDLSCSIMIPCPCSMLKFSCTLAVWPESVFSCVIYVRIHLTLEPTDQLCQALASMPNTIRSRNHADTERVEMEHKMTI